MTIEKEFEVAFFETAFALAADRSTKSLPVFFAEIIFIGGWVLALIKTASSDPGPTNWVNVEAQSVAISAMFLWVTSAVVLGAIMGVPQSEESVPRILQRYEYDIATMRVKYDQTRGKVEQRRASAEGRAEEEWCPSSTIRAAAGGMYSWKPKKWTHSPSGTPTSRRTLLCHAGIAILVVGCSYLTAAILSYLVPPQGPSCRHIVESIM
jgi:hypothetical protein